MTELSQGLDNIAINAIAVWLIQNVKTSKVPFFSWINENTPGISRFVSVLAAALTAVGVGWSFQSDSGVLTISGLSWTALATFVWHVTKNYAFQHVMYKSSYGVDKYVSDAVFPLAPLPTVVDSSSTPPASK
jgi:hypothetical protein